MLHFSRNLGIDLGTATVLVYVQGKGIVLREPSVVAVDRDSGRLLKVGTAAQEMLGRTPGNILALRPLRDGVISDLGMTRQMLRAFLRKAVPHALFKPRMVVCVPSGITEVEERAVVDAGIQAGARKVYLIEEPLAAALGAGIQIAQPQGHLLVDIGGGTADAAVIALSGVVAAESIKVAGDQFDEAIIKYVRQTSGVLIGARTAEEVKLAIGCVIPQEEEQTVTVRGRSLNTGLPQELTLTSTQLLEAFQKPAGQILEAIHRVLERTPPELIGDVAENGITMTGGGSLLPGFAQLVEKRTGIPTMVAEDAVSCVAKGTGLALSRLKDMTDGTIQLARSRMGI